jgi:hypothetical protein
MKSSNGPPFAIFFIALIFMFLGTVFGGNVLMTNFDESRGTQVPVSLASGTALLQGGSVQVGSFVGADPAVLINGLISPAGLAALLSNFVAFGPAATVGASFSGLYAVDVSVPLNATSPLVGQSIYTLIGNATTLSTSSELAIIRHASLFEADVRQNRGHPLKLSISPLLQWGSMISEDHRGIRDDRHRGPRERRASTSSASVSSSQEGM